MSTFHPGVSATARLLQLRDGANLYTALAEADEIHLAIVGTDDAIVGATRSTSFGDVATGVVGIDASPGDWHAFIDTPSAVGNYRLRWTTTLNGRVGVFYEDFAVRTH